MSTYLKQERIPNNRYKENQTEDNFIDDNDDEYEYDNDNDTAIDDYLNTEKSKIIVTTVPSLRLDAIAKAGFGMSRAKVDREFYMSNIRVNGKKCFKKGIKVNLGDEIDFIQKRSPDNSNYLIINRCILLSIKTEQKEDFKIKLLQNKSLLIEEYKDKWHNDTTN
ncbi:hypothetical protein APICC_01699 [Apis cerana cerana]|uniref:Mitochondrial transcription rescue factor 1 C-terminal domain-containing protein n=1 Tax=Apis cerana cerana TaxID=94128 RepID=A0A2A3E3A0_APICC|nr:hypothetical protein APICC_01699 [Apis cerana cerana]